MNAHLDQLQQKQWLWKGAEAATQATRRLASGYPLLDRYLAGGWPDSGVIELQPSHWGIGELRLILPLLQTLVARDPEGLQVWINPPARLTPYSLPRPQSPQLLLLRPRQPQQALWAAEQALNSGHCSYLVLWQRGLNPAQAKRLQLAARTHQALAFVISRPPRTRQALPLTLRMSLQPAAQGLTLEVTKQQQGWPLPPLQLAWHEAWPQLCLPVDQPRFPILEPLAQPLSVPVNELPIATTAAANEPHA